MLLEKKNQAKNLYFQSELTKTQIADLLQVSRRSVSNWIKEGNWHRLKVSAEHLPSIIADNCYHLMGQVTEHHLSEYRLTNPISPKEIDGLYKLSLTINKLKNRSTLNESMEMFCFFLDGLKASNEKLAEEIAPYIDKYISSRADIYRHNLVPSHFTGVGGRIPWRAEEKDTTEEKLDYREAFFSDPETIKAYADAGIPFPSEEEICTLPSYEPLKKEEEEKPAPAPDPVTHHAEPLPKETIKATASSQQETDDEPRRNRESEERWVRELSPAQYALYQRMWAAKQPEQKITSPQLT